VVVPAVQVAVGAANRSCRRRHSWFRHDTPNTDYVVQSKRGTHLPLPNQTSALFGATNQVSSTTKCGTDARRAG